MKYIVLIALLFPFAVSAKSSGGGKHLEGNPPYDCSVTKKPETPKWVTGIKKERLNNKAVTITWDDSKRAHEVQIRYKSGGKWKTKTTGDDSRQEIKKLKNGKLYSFQVRGVSNCGKSKWSPIYKSLP